MTATGQSTEKTTRQIVAEAVMDLHQADQLVTREAIHSITGLRLTVIDDRLKALVADEQIIRLRRGVFLPLARHAPSRQISHTELPDGTVVLDIGDDVLHLTPREARVLGAMLGGRAMQASQIEAGHQAAVIVSDLVDSVRMLAKIQAGQMSRPAAIRPKSAQQMTLMIEADV